MATSNQDIEKYSYLWIGGPESLWILLKDKTGACLPFNVATRNALVIENDDVSFMVVERMIKEGVRVLEKPPPAPNKKSPCY